MEEQLRGDEELARSLSTSINSNYERNTLASPLSSRKSDPVTNKSQKKNTSKQKTFGDIQKYLSPKLKPGTALACKAELEEDICKSKETDRSDTKSPVLQDTEIEKNIPTLSPQTCLETQEQGSESSAGIPGPQLCVGDTKESLEGKVETVSTSPDDLCIVNDDGPRATVFYSNEAAVNSSSKIENEEYSVTGVPQLTGGNRVPTESRVYHLLVEEEISDRENQESVFEEVMDPCFSAKRRKIFIESSSDQEETLS